MRISTAVTALAAACLVATATGATAPAAVRPAAGGCTPSWKLITTPAPPGTEALLSGATVSSAKDAWFPGWSNTYAVLLHPWVLHWDGHSLGAAAAVPQNPFIVRDAEAGSFDSATDGWVLGGGNAVFGPQYAAHWTGTRWAITPLAVSPDPTSEGLELTSVASLSPSDAWAVGVFYIYTEALGALIEHWDGTQWSIVPNPVSSLQGTTLTGISVVSPTDIWAVGQQPDANGTQVPLAEHWDGTSWTAVPAPAGNSPSAFGSVSADGPDDAWAVGEQLEPGTSDLATGLVEHWDGTRWSVVTSLPGLGNSKLTNVYAASSADVWATVYAPRPNTDIGVDEFLHWDGSSWTTVPVPGPHEDNLDYEYDGIAGSGPDDIWAAGSILHEPTPRQGFNDTTPLIAHLSCN